MVSIFISYSVFLLLTLCLLYVLGSILLYFLKIKINGFYLQTFAKLLLGLTVFVVVTAMIYTKGLTIQVLFLPLLFFLAYKYSKKTENTSIKTSYNFSNIAAIFLGILCIFCFRFGQLYNFESNIPIAPHGDIIYYANCIDFLASFGNENSSVDYMNPQGNSPYHYFELWFGVGVSRLFALNTALSLVLIIYSIGNILIWLGLCAILSSYKELKIIDIFFCLFLLTTTGLVFDLYTKVEFMKYIYVYTFNSLNYSKLYVVYIFAIASWLFFMRDKRLEAITCLIAIPIGFVTTAIGVFSGLFVWIFVEYFMRRKFHYRELLACILIALSIFIFYKFITISVNTHVNTNANDLIKKLTAISYLKTILNIGIGSTIQILLMFLPFLILLFLNKSIHYKALNSSEFYLFVCIYIFSLLGWGVLHDKTSSTQVFTNITLIILNIFTSVSMLIIWQEKKSKLLYLNYMFLGIVLILSFKNSIISYRFPYPQSNKYVDTILQKSKELSQNGAFIFTKEEYLKMEFSYVANLVIKGNYLLYSQKQTFPTSLSPYNYPISKNKFVASLEVAALENTPFWMYVEKQKKEGVFKNIEESQVSFIKQYNINYLICSKNVILSEYLQKIIKNEIVDSNTRERFIQLKN